MDTKFHFKYQPLKVGFEWYVASKHEYALSPSRGLTLCASIDGKTLGAASALDHIIWDEIEKKGKHEQCDCLTLWTKDLEFNLILFGDRNVATTSKCAYFLAPVEKMCKEHIAYWRRLRFFVALPRGLASSSQNVRVALPTLIVWNRYVKVSQGKFTRYHALARDLFRFNLQTIPLPTDFLDETNHLNFCPVTEPSTEPSATSPINKNDYEYVKAAAENLYKRVLQRYDFVTGCGSAMQRNLLTLASLLADPNIKVALVTGEPGTGKEALCKAIYYGNKVRQPTKGDEEYRFVQTTAIEIQNAMGKGKTPAEFLIDKLGDKLSKRRPVIFIDELNKAEQYFLGAMLRPLEQGKTELETDGEPKYILAASQHIDDLARKPPQDFWTRISHQLRVVHPLSRVSEEDGKAFLESFFYSNWWGFVQRMVNVYGQDDVNAQELIKVFIGEITGKKEVDNGYLKLSNLCICVRDEFLHTLVPLVSRDTLSVRGARSILSQVFARISWYVRFQRPLMLSDKGSLENETRNQVAQLVNSAVQDVMAILNAARATPAGMEEKKLDNHAAVRG